jgi:hypothetical protein
MAKTRKAATVVWVTPTSIPTFISIFRAILLNLLANPGYFGTIIPAPATITPHLNTLATAESVVLTGVKGAAAARDLVLDPVVKDKKTLVSAIQTLCDNAATYEIAVAIAQAAGMRVKVNGVHVKPPFQANPFGAGKAKLIRKKVPGASYDWQDSHDGGLTWGPLPGSKQADTIADGYTSNTDVLFRSRANLPGKPGVWLVEACHID